MSTTPAPDNIPWYKSNIVRLAAVALITQLLKHFKIADQFTSVDIATFVDEGLALVGTVSAAGIIYSRAKHPLPTITLTQAKADQANAASTLTTKPMERLP